MQAVSRAFFALEKTRTVGRMTVAMLARFPGWDKASASRYLSFLAQAGWLEKVNQEGHPTYVLGRKVLDLAPDFKL